MRLKELAKPIRPLALLFPALCVFALGAPPAQAQGKAAEELDKIATTNGVKRPPVINVKPFEDIATKGKELIDQGKIDLKNSTLDVTATAGLNDDGTLKPETVKIEGLPDDANMAALAQQLVTALSRSKVFSALKGAKDVRIALKLDRQSVSIRIAIELQSEEDAVRYATGYGLMLAIARNSKKGASAGELYDSMKVGNEGKQFTMSFEMPKDAAGKMIADILAKSAAARGRN